MKLDELDEAFLNTDHPQHIWRAEHRDALKRCAEYVQRIESLEEQLRALRKQLRQEVSS